MKVIVAGYPKTGTKSINCALTTLGYKVYDFPENIFQLCDDYKKIFAEGWLTDDFKRMYQNADAVVDTPACLFWEEIYKAFPDSKIILTVREDEDEWFQSMQKLVNAAHSNISYRLLNLLSPTHRRANEHVIDKMGALFGWPHAMMRRKTRMNSPLMKMNYRAHNAYVIHTAPKDRLLVFKCSEGWEPLCKFLGVPVPDEPFPHKNKAGGVVREAMETYPQFSKMQREAVVSAVLLLSATVILGYYTYKLGPGGMFNLVTSARGCFQRL